MARRDNPLRPMANELRRNMTAAVSYVCTTAAENMKDRLVANGHYRTGRTADSITPEVTETGSRVVGRVYGSKVLDFLDKGTGAAHGRPGGRVGYWRYKDEEGNWHTTDGMDADPFIEQSIADAMDGLVEEAARRITRTI